MNDRKHVRLTILSDAGMKCEFTIATDAPNRAKACEELGRSLGAIIRESTEGDEALMKRFMEQFAIGGREAMRTHEPVKVKFRQESEVAS